MKIKLLVDKEYKLSSDIVEASFKAGDVVDVKTRYMYNKTQPSKVLYCGGYGVYLYAHEGEYEIVEE